MRKNKGRTVTVTYKSGSAPEPKAIVQETMAQINERLEIGKSKRLKGKIDSLMNLSEVSIKKEDTQDKSARGSVKTYSGGRCSPR